MLCAVLAAGCDESLESVAGPTPNLTPTFASIQRDIFQATDSSGRPSCTSCHNPNGGAFRAVGLDLSTEGYASLVGVASRQKPERASRRARRPREQLSHPEDRSTGRYRRHAHAAARPIPDGRTDRDHRAMDRAWRQETTEERLRLMTRLLLLIVTLGLIGAPALAQTRPRPRRRTIPIST